MPNGICPLFSIVKGEQTFCLKNCVFYNLNSCTLKSLSNLLELNSLNDISDNLERIAETLEQNQYEDKL